MTDFDTSDPLPFIMVHRSAEGLAGSLASSAKVTNQHALGALVLFWGRAGVGDPRRLERVVREAREKGTEPRIVLTRDELALRWQIAFGQETPPEMLAALGIVELVEDGHWRVRGGSRLLKPIVERIEKHEQASAAGKASAAVRRERNGTAQPQKKGVREPVREPVQTVVRTPVQTPAQTAAEPGPEPEPEQTPNQARSREEREEKILRRSVDDAPEIQLFIFAQTLRAELGLAPENPPEDLGDWYSTAVAHVGPERLRLAVRRWLEDTDKYWRDRGFPWAGFAAQYQRHARRCASGDASEGTRVAPATPEARRWAEVLSSVRNAGEPYAATQLESLKPVALEGGTLSVRTEDGLFAEFCRQHFAPLLGAEVRILGPDVSAP